VSAARPIYLDYNATTPIDPEVFEAMEPYLRDHFGNASSGHAHGQEARRAIEAARAEVAALISAAPDEIYFTSGGTEASNLAIFGVASAAPWPAIGGMNPPAGAIAPLNASGPRDGLVTSAIEHPATARPLEALAGRGYQLTRLPVDAGGRVTADAIDAAISERTLLLSLIHANNETGVIQPVEQAAARARAVGALSHADAAQSAGKIEVSVERLGVDLLSIAGHKLYAPKGIGALYVRRGTQIRPVLLGAGHERGLRPGTENVAGIVGLGRACALARARLAADGPALARRRDRLLTLLRQGVERSDRAGGLVVHGETHPRLPNTLSLRFQGILGPALLEAAPELAASTGSACHDGQTSASAVIVAMGVAPADALGTLRLTIGRPTTDEQIELAAAALLAAREKLLSS